MLSDGFTLQLQHLLFMSWGVLVIDYMMCYGTMSTKEKNYLDYVWSMLVVHTRFLIPSLEGKLLCHWVIPEPTTTYLEMVEEDWVRYGSAQGLAMCQGSLLIVHGPFEMLN